MKREFDEYTNLFENKKCKLLLSIDDYYKNKIILTTKVKFIASCGHERISSYHAMNKNNNDWLCCKCNINNVIETNKKNNKSLNGSSITNVIENRAYLYIKKMLKKDFKIVKTFEGGLSDFIIKPIDEAKDKWLQIQLKTTNKSVTNTKYSFTLNKKDYSGMIVLAVCLSNNIYWLLDGHMIKEMKNLTVSINKYTKYKPYQKILSNINQDLKNHYIGDNITKIKLINVYDNINEYKLREIEYATKRLSIDMPFIVSDIEQMNYDFTLNGKKFQEKVCRKTIRLQDRYEAHMSKSNGRSNKKVPYAKNDNDFYWFHIPLLNKYYVIPEYELINRGFITTSTQQGITSIGFYPIFNNKYRTTRSHFANEYYLFDYSNESITKLKKLLNFS